MRVIGRRATSAAGCCCCGWLLDVDFVRSLFSKFCWMIQSCLSRSGKWNSVPDCWQIWEKSEKATIKCCIHFMMRIMCTDGLKASWGTVKPFIHLISSIGSHATATKEKENVVNDVSFYLLSKCGNCALWMLIIRL